MFIKTLKLKNFRCYEDFNVEFSEGINIITGENGVGKTCLLEAVFFISTLRSPRASKEKELLRFGAGSAGIESVFSKNDFIHTAGVFLEEGKKRLIEYDSVRISSPREWLGTLPSIFFSPGDLDILRGGPAGKRKFMDVSLCQIYPRYLSALSQFRRVHEGKTRLLRLIGEKSSFKSALPEYNLKIAQLSVELARYRLEFIQKISALSGRHHEAITGGLEKISLDFKTHSKSTGEFLSLLEEKSESEILQKQCLYGAHRDDFECMLNGHNIKLFGSQGQTRTAALSLKLAERDLFTSETGSTPVLLLDDVLSELDESRREYILSQIGGGQIFVSSVDAESLKNLKFGNTINIEREKNADVSAFGR